MAGPTSLSGLAVDRQPVDRQGRISCPARAHRPQRCRLGYRAPPRVLEHDHALRGQVPRRGVERLGDPRRIVRRIGDDDVERPAHVVGERADCRAADDSTAVFDAAVRRVGADQPQGARIAVDERDPRCAAAERPEADRSGAARAAASTTAPGTASPTGFSPRPRLHRLRHRPPGALPADVRLRPPRLHRRAAVEAGGAAYGAPAREHRRAPGTPDLRADPDALTDATAAWARVHGLAAPPAGRPPRLPARPAAAEREEVIAAIIDAAFPPDTSSSGRPATPLAFRPPRATARICSVQG